MLVGHAEHLSIREFAPAVDHWLLWADPDGAWRDQTDSVDHRAAHVVVTGGEVSIGGVGGDVLTAETLTNIFAHFVEAEFRKDCETRKAQHGERADEFAAATQRCAASLRRASRRSSIRPTPPAATASCPTRSSTSSATNTPCTTSWAAPGSCSPTATRVDVDELTRHQIDAVLAEFVRDPATILTRRCETSSGHPCHPAC